MPSKRSPRRQPQRQHQAKPLNAQAGETAPRTAREWVVFRAGVREGIELAHADAHTKADQFLTRFSCGGVELSTPSAADAERSRVKTPAESTPVKKRSA